MIELDDRVTNFLASQKLGVLSNISAEGYPQVSVIHFSHKLEPLTFYISTDDNTRKVKNLAVGKKASLVVGLTEEDWITVQMDGEMELVEDDMADALAHHYKKFPGLFKFKDKEETIMIKFTPNFLRYTDFNPEPKFKLEYNNMLY